MTHLSASSLSITSRVVLCCLLAAIAGCQSDVDKLLGQRKFSEALRTTESKDNLSRDASASSRADARSRVGDINELLHNWAEAETAFRDELRLRPPSANVETIAHARQALAIALRRQAGATRTTEAVQLFESACPAYKQARRLREYAACLEVWGEALRDANPAAAFEKWDELEAQLRRDDPIVAQSKVDRGRTIYGSRPYDSLRLVQEAASILRSNPAERHQLGSTLLALAGLCGNLNLRDESRQAFEEAASLLIEYYRHERLHPELGDLFYSMGVTAFKCDEFKAADKYLRRAKEVRDQHQRGEADRLKIVDVLASQGLLYQEWNKYEEAYSYYQAALKELESLQPLVAAQRKLVDVYNNFAILLVMLREFDSADVMVEKARSLIEKLGGRHPIKANVLTNKGEIEWSRNHPSEALRWFLEAADLFGQRLSNVPGASSQHDKRRFLRNETNWSDLIRAFYFESAPGSQPMREKVLENILRFKGRVTSDAAEDLIAARSQAEQSDAATRLVASWSDRAQFLLGNPLARKSPEVQQMILRERLLESELAKKPQGSVTVREISGAVPDNGVLVEFSTFRTYDRNNTSLKDRWSPTQYVAFVLGPDGRSESIRLGPTSEIDGWIEQFYDAISQPGSCSLQLSRCAFDRPSEELAQLILRPVVKLARSVNSRMNLLIVAPEGMLNVVPFAALPLEPGRALVHSHAVQYVMSGRDLIRVKRLPKSYRQSVIVGDPDFGEAPEPVQRLPGTAREALGITEMLKRYGESPKLLLKAEASETRLRAVNAPKILHIGTHAFLSGIGEISTQYWPFEPTSLKEVQKDEDDSLIESGLIFANFNSPHKREDDAVLTALEASSLNLIGTQLVTLSACQTGLGVVVAGDGVYGLRRGFTLAGARALALSLWKVSDASTVEFMELFYSYLLTGISKPEALRAAQLRMLNHPRFSHPFFWSAFVVSGDLSPIEHSAKK